MTDAPGSAPGLRFDHAVIGVHDLDAAMADFVALGFDVREGGSHPRRGTANAVVRFGLDYLELLAVEHTESAWGATLAAHLDQRGEGLLAYALATDDVDGVAAALRRAGAAVTGPEAMERERPDGQELRWRILLPAAAPWRATIPIVLQWDPEAVQALAWEPPSEHPNGTTGVAGVRVLTTELDNLVARYRDGLGLSGVRGGPDARHVEFVTDGCVLDVLETEDGGAEGPFEITLAVADLEATARYLRDTGLSVHADENIRLASAQTHGAQLLLREVTAGDLTRR